VVAYGKSKFTIEEYYQMELISQEKHEYYQGDIFAMSGTKVRPITLLRFAELRQRLKGQSCRPFNSDQRIHVPQNSLFTYPDIS
jgi:hypothetical protein